MKKWSVFLLTCKNKLKTKKSIHYNVTQNVKKNQLVPQKTRPYTTTPLNKIKNDSFFLCPTKLAFIQQKYLSKVYTFLYCNHNLFLWSMVLKKKHAKTLTEMHIEAIPQKNKPSSSFVDSKKKKTIALGMHQ